MSADRTTSAIGEHLEFTLRLEFAIRTSARACVFLRASPGQATLSRQFADSHPQTKMA